MKRPKRKTRAEKIEEARRDMLRPGLKYKEELNRMDDDELCRDDGGC